ncbi:hypothetical protein [Rhodopseudomonas palustris]|uniref:Uncharacterized protein n=1 Tax=Rhodopseudomonas palustris (strain BisB18) TaxID=316056 RepID=Q21AB6_RHOPB
MSADMVARLLANFDQPEPARGRSRVVPFDHALHSAPKTPPRPAPPPVDDAYQRGVADGYAAAIAEYEQKLDAERSKFGAQLDDQRNALLDEVAGKITDEILELGRRFEVKIAGVTARILEPLIVGVVQKQAVASFVEKLSSVTSDNLRPALRITAPPELIELVRSKLGARAMSVELVAGALPEVSIIADQVVLETQVKVWADRLKFAVLA